MDYTSITPQQRQEMLEVIGISSVEDLFAVIPDACRLDRPLDLEPARSELELQRELTRLSEANIGPHNRACFMGGGSYDHFIPAFIDQVISRGEYLTAYTPYQGEASQGSLQAFFEFQTQVARLTGLDIANASLYEGASATAEAILLALNATGKRRVLVASTLHPDYLQVVRTVCEGLPCDVVMLPATGGRVDAATVAEMADDDTAAAVIPSPNIYGLIEDWKGCFAALKGASTVGNPPCAIAVFHPIACGLLAKPGECGADIAAGEGQPLGVPMSLGGPYLGLLSARSTLMRKMPGRLVGQTSDTEGRRAFCLSLQTREQHIKRSKATSNVCTNQGLLALRATMYMSAMGPNGLREVAEQCWHKAHHLASRISALPGFSLPFKGPFFNEFVIRCPRPARDYIRAGKPVGLLAGIALDSPRLARLGDERDLLIAVTEKRSRRELDMFVDFLSVMPTEATKESA
ncbi:MAG: aminomethyl-transferring glycine dehydrogenase subunit GcvPA [Phycisphaerales bacterium]|nr:aminomethyl-transferring glycine dehydrogenase subunit GcvPA [Phycisphaerales bacterium]